MCFSFNFTFISHYHGLFLVLSFFFLSSHSAQSPPPAISPFSSSARPDPSPFRPSIGVVIGVLTAVFSVTFLILLYAKHCKRVDSSGSGDGGGYYSNYEGRKNSGIDRGVIETLPIFRFGSLYGQKEGLECAVCLCRFEPSEVLRLLPKCKHGFHVECVDTWLDAHSTCPLCRYRVDPEDILLVHDSNFRDDVRDSESGVEEVSVSIRRVSGRHSSAGERGSNQTTSYSRRSLDSSSRAVGCFDHYQRKDGLLLPSNEEDKTRFEHRIIISSKSGPHQERWSDLQPSDLLYLRSEMIITSGRDVISGRSMSEITGLNRFSGRGSNGNGTGRGGERENERQVGVARRWLAWVSSLSQTAPRPVTVA